MKKILFFLTSFFSTISNSCPTCVGKVNASTVPFFHEEFYQPGKQNTTHSSAAEYGQKELKKLIDTTKEKNEIK